MNSLLSFRGSFLTLIFSAMALLFKRTVVFSYVLGSYGFVVTNSSIIFSAEELAEIASILAKYVE